MAVKGKQALKPSAQRFKQIAEMNNMKPKVSSKISNNDIIQSLQQQHQENQKLKKELEKSRNLSIIEMELGSKNQALQELNKP